MPVSYEKDARQKFIINDEETWVFLDSWLTTCDLRENLFLKQHLGMKNLRLLIIAMFLIFGELLINYKTWIIF